MEHHECPLEHEPAVTKREKKKNDTTLIPRVPGTEATYGSV